MGVTQMSAVADRFVRIKEIPVEFFYLGLALYHSPSALGHGYAGGVYK